MTFTIHLARDLGDTATVSVNYTTVAGTALANVDFVSKTGTAIFTTNETEEVVNVSLLDDAVAEDAENFTLKLTTPSGASITDDTGVATITDADAAPLVSISGTTVDEGDSGTTDARFVVALSAPSGRTVSVTAATSDGVAKAGSDYITKTETLSFTPGQVSKPFIVQVTPDVKDEDQSEDFNATLSAASGATIVPPNPATGTILDDDDTPALSINDASGTEGTTANFTVTLSAESGRTVTVNAATSSITAGAGQDYVNKSDTLTFAPGETSKPFPVTLLHESPVVDEPDETFLVTLSAESGAIVSDRTGTGTVLDEDAGPELYFEPLAVAGLENAGPLNFTVKLSQAVPPLPLSGVSVSFEVVNVTADAADYTVVTPPTLVFPPGSPAGATRAITANVVNDGLAEADETFKIRLVGPSGGAQIRRDQGEATGTIQNEDGEPAHVFVDDLPSVTEGTGGTATASFTVRLSAPVGTAVAVTYATQDGTANAGADYDLASSVVVFASGETSKTVDVPVTTDTLDEDDETFSLVLSNPTNAVLEDGTATATITDDDNPPVVSIDPAAIEIDEGSVVTSGKDVVVKLSTASGKTVTVPYTTGPDADAMTPDAIADTDYSAPGSATLTFKPGETQKRIRVEAVGDQLDEDPEIFLVNLGSPTNASLAAPPAPGVVTINDDDALPTVSITGPEPVDEPVSSSGETDAVFIVSLSVESGRAVMVEFATADGGEGAPDPATAPADYTDISGAVQIGAGELGTEVAVIVQGDNADENNEVFSVTLSNPTNAELSEEPDDVTASAVILDTDGPPALSVIGAIVSEGDGPGTATVTVRLLPAVGNGNGNVTVKLGTADGTALAPGDYTALSPPATITFAPGQTSQTQPVAIVGEAVDEPNENFSVTLSEPSGPTTGPAAVIGTASDRVTITDDDGPSISVADVTVTEGTGASPTNAVFSVVLSAPSPQTVAVDYSTGAGSAGAPSDFESKSGSLVFATGETAKTVGVPVAGDSEDEADEQFTFSLSNPVNAEIGRAVAEGTIFDDDQPTLFVSAAVGTADPPSVLEGDAGSTLLNFTLNLTAATTREASVSYATTSTRAVAGGDFLPVAGRVTFAPGETTRTVVVSVIGDSLDEPDETVNLALSAPVNLSLPAQALGTILDDDKPGYFMVATDGGIFSFGDAGFYGSTGSLKLNQPIVGAAAHPSGRGYWLVATDGGVFTFGEAAFYGSTGGLKLNRPIVGMAPTPSGNGYWLVATDGGIFSFGDAAFQGSTGALTLNKPVVGMASTPSGKGYWLVATDGGIFAFGDAAFYGSTGSLTLNQPIVGMASTSGGKGYWLVATDGGIFTFGDAVFKGSTGGVKLNRPIVGMAPTPTGNGYWLVATDGGIFTFGDAEFLGSTGNLTLNKPVAGMAVL